MSFLNEEGHYDESIVSNFADRVAHLFGERQARTDNVFMMAMSEAISDFLRSGTSETTIEIVKRNIKTIREMA